MTILSDDREEPFEKKKKRKAEESDDSDSGHLQNEDIGGSGDKGDSVGEATGGGPGF